MISFTILFQKNQHNLTNKEVNWNLFFLTLNYIVIYQSYSFAAKTERPTNYSYFSHFTNWYNANILFK